MARVGTAPLTRTCWLHFRQEVRQLSSALDEEKKMRISLQVTTTPDAVMLYFVGVGTLQTNPCVSDRWK